MADPGADLPPSCTLYITFSTGSSVGSAFSYDLRNSYNMGCPPVCGESMSFSEWIILGTGGQIWYNYFIPLIYISVDLAQHESW